MIITYHSQFGHGSLRYLKRHDTEGRTWTRWLGLGRVQQLEKDLTRNIRSSRPELAGNSLNEHLESSTLWWFNIAMENDPFIDIVYLLIAWWCSMAMWVITCHNQMLGKSSKCFQSMFLIQPYVWLDSDISDICWECRRFFLGGPLVNDDPPRHSTDSKRNVRHPMNRWWQARCS